MKIPTQKFVLTAALLAVVGAAQAGCLGSDKISLILGAKARKESLASIRKGFFPSADAAMQQSIDDVYHSGVKPWDASDYSAVLCASPESRHGKDDPRYAPGFEDLPPKAQVDSYLSYENGGASAADQERLERLKEANYRSSFDEMQNIPGVCVGEECNHVRKIQRWDANGNMLN